MRGLLTVILFIIFFFSFSIAAFAYSLGSIVRADYIKNRLTESKIYTAVAGELPEMISRSENGGDELVPIEVKNQLTGFIKRELTAEYLQNKIEPFVDNTFVWLAGKTETTPSLSFSDLGKKLEPLAVSPLLSDEFSQMLAEPITFELEGSEQLRSGFQLLQMAPIIFSVGGLLVLLVIFLMARGWKSKLRKVSLALFIPTIIGLLTVAATFLIGNLLVGLATGALGGSEFERFSKPLNDLLIQIPLDISVRLATIYGAVLAASVILFAVSFFVSRKKEAAQTQEQASTT